MRGDGCAPPRLLLQVVEGLLFLGNLPGRHFSLDSHRLLHFAPYQLQRFPSHDADGQKQKEKDHQFDQARPGIFLLYSFGSRIGSS